MAWIVVARRFAFAIWPWKAKSPPSYYSGRAFLNNSVGTMVLSIPRHTSA
jgi:hypothetical protein